MSGALRAKNRAVMRGKPGSHSDRGWGRHIWRHGSVEPEGWGGLQVGPLVHLHLLSELAITFPLKPHLIPLTAEMVS